MGWYPRLAGKTNRGLLSDVLPAKGQRWPHPPHAILSAHPTPPQVQGGGDKQHLSPPVTVATGAGSTPGPRTRPATPPVTTSIPCKARPPPHRPLEALTVDAALPAPGRTQLGDIMAGPLFSVAVVVGRAPWEKESPPVTLPPPSAGEAKGPHRPRDQQGGGHPFLRRAHFLRHGGGGRGFSALFLGNRRGESGGGGEQREARRRNQAGAATVLLGWVGELGPQEGVKREGVEGCWWGGRHLVFTLCFLARCVAQKPPTGLWSKCSGETPLLASPLALKTKKPLPQAGRLLVGGPAAASALPWDHRTLLPPPAGGGGLCQRSLVGRGWCALAGLKGY